MKKFGIKTTFIKITDKETNETLLEWNQGDEKPLKFKHKDEEFEITLHDDIETNINHGGN